VGVTAHEALVADGYRFITAVPTADGDYDGQRHLNNAATVRIFNDLRIAYVQGVLGDWWPQELREHGYIVAAREVHVLYESEAFPDEELVGAMRYAYRQGKAAIVEQRLLEHTTGRPVARAWVVQLLARGGRAVEWPARYFDAVGAFEGRAIEIRARRGAPAWGPPE
jgi:acyl-CoA thioesterase FadM